MVQGLVRLTLLAVLLLSGCAVTPPAEKAEPVTADTELKGSPAMALLSRAEQARHWFEEEVQSGLLARLTSDPDTRARIRDLGAEVAAGTTSPDAAAAEVLAGLMPPD